MIPMSSVRSKQTHFSFKNGETDNRVVTKSASLNGHIVSLWLYNTITQ